MKEVGAKEAFKERSRALTSRLRDKKAVSEMKTREKEQIGGQTGAFGVLAGMEGLRDFWRRPSKKPAGISDLGLKREVRDSQAV